MVVRFKNSLNWAVGETASNWLHRIPKFLDSILDVLTKCSNKFGCQIKEMVFIRKFKTSLNVQTYSLEELVSLCYNANL